MQVLDTSSVDFSNAYATLCRNVFAGGTSDNLASKSESVQKRKIQPFPTDSSFALMKLPQVLAHMQVSRSGWLEGVRIGRYPAPVRLSKRRVAWRVSDLKAFIESL
jgi:predicted DNA-binding transcriptional regulator AlpA